jgi:hypothetical protein
MTCSPKRDVIVAPARIRHNYTPPHETSCIPITCQKGLDTFVEDIVHSTNYMKPYMISKCIYRASHIIADQEIKLSQKRTSRTDIDQDTQSWRLSLDQRFGHHVIPMDMMFAAPSAKIMRH